MSVVKFFSENHLHLSNVVAARIGRGLKELPPIKGHAGSMVIVWRLGGSYVQFLEPSKHDGRHVERVRFDMERADWAQLRVLQLLMCEDVAAVADASGGRQTEAGTAPDDLSANRLSTIPEGTQETDLGDNQSSVGSYLQHSDPNLQAALDKETCLSFRWPTSSRRKRATSSLTECPCPS